jgi:tRNA(Ile)-lysidine synthase
MRAHGDRSAAALQWPRTWMFDDTATKGARPPFERRRHHRCFAPAVADHRPSENNCSFASFGNSPQEIPPPAATQTRARALQRCTGDAVASRDRPLASGLRWTDVGLTPTRQAFANCGGLWRHARMAAMSVTATLDGALSALPPGPVAVACSGGADSCTLLHALAASAQARMRGLRVLHVDHGLHADSSRWAAHCATLAASLGLPIDVRVVTVDRQRGTGLEEAARSARLAAFAAALRPGEFLALAQHRDDQAETVLLKLLRGAGPEGLGGMRALRACGHGWLWRPLLDLPKSALQDYARRHNLAWIDDPSNAQTHLDRNFLRVEILPRLRDRWPEVEKPLAHSAQWFRAAADFIDAEARKALARLQGIDASTLAWRGWLALDDALRDPVLRLWLRDLGLDEPSHLHLAELERQLREAEPDRMPCVAYAQTELRRYRDLLYGMRPVPSAPAQWQSEWRGESLLLPAGGTLFTQPETAFAVSLRVSFRAASVRIKPAGGAHTRELRLLLQEAGVPPWQRDHIPLVWRGAELLAVGDLVLSDAGETFCDEHGLRFAWQPTTPTGAAHRPMRGRE